MDVMIEAWMNEVPRAHKVVWAGVCGGDAVLDLESINAGDDGLITDDADSPECSKRK